MLKISHTQILKIKKATIVTTVMLFGLLNIAPLQARTNATLPPPPNTNEKEIVAKSKDFLNAVKKMEKFMSITEEGTILLNAHSAKEIDIEVIYFDALKSALADTNQKIKDGEFRLTGKDFQLEPTTKNIKRNLKEEKLGNRRNIDQTASQVLVCQSPWGGGWMIADSATGAQVCAYQLWFGPVVEMNNQAVSDLTSSGWTMFLAFAPNPLNYIIGGSLGTIWAVNAAGGYQGVFVMWMWGIQLAVLPR